MNLLLDTCALLWLVTDQTQLSEPAVDAMADPTSTLFVSPISGFEIVLKVRKGRLDLPVPPRTWLEHAFHTYRLHEAPLSLRVAADAGDVALPHGDPADRIIVATARAMGMPLITADRIIRASEVVPVIW